MQPSATDQNVKTEIKPRKLDAFEGYITWRALGGLIIDEEYKGTDERGNPKTFTNHVRQMTLGEFCEAFNVDRATTWRWRTNTPNLAELVEKRRNEIIPVARVSAAWNQLFLLGMQSGDKRAAVDALKTFLGHYGNLQLPVQREIVKHEGESWASLVAAKRKQVESTTNATTSD